jgi:hypothetical protein
MRNASIARSGTGAMRTSQNSVLAKFAFLGFYEVGQEFIGNSSPLASVAESADLGGADHPALSERGRL